MDKATVQLKTTSLFDTLTQTSVPEQQPKGGTKILYEFASIKVHTPTKFYPSPDWSATFAVRKIPTSSQLWSASFWSAKYPISDATILVFGIRYDIDTILPKYRNIDMISIFYKVSKNRM